MAAVKLMRATSCPSKISNTMVKTTTALGSTKVTTMKRCGNCGGLGHNRRTCPTLVKKEMKVKEYTTTQLFARLPNYIIPEKVKKTPALEGLKGCKGLFRESKISPFPPASESRATLYLASLL